MPLDFSAYDENGDVIMILVAQITGKGEQGDGIDGSSLLAFKTNPK